MDAIINLLLRLRQRREKKARDKELLRELRAIRSRFQLESLEPRLLLSSTPIAVTQFEADASGFTAHLSQAVDATVLSLYDTEDGSLGPADVTLVGVNQGAVKGSLVASGDQLTFIKTGSPLAPDVYTVTMRSASNGIRGTDGSLLDGNSDGTGGDSYVHTFTIDSITGPTVGIADVVRGPGQVIQVPAPNPGIPISISDGTGVTSVELTLQFDPSLLKIIGFVPGSALPAGSSVLPELTDTGKLTFRVTSPTAMTPGPLELLRLVSEVPHTSTYGATGLLDIRNLSINNGSMAATADDGVEAVAYFADVTGSRTYSALDASRILRVVVGIDTGYAAFPAIDPVLLSDVTGNDALSALDGTRVLQEVVGLDRPEIQAITPVIQMQLANDTGASSTDKLTFDPTITGTARDDGTIVSLKARIDTATSIDVTSDLINGSFSFNRARLEEILSAPLSDGAHTLSLQAIDNGGNISTVSSFSFTLDATPPTITSFNLSAGSDTGTLGDNVTAAENVLLTGASEAGAHLLLNATPILAGAGGVFQIPDVDLALGQNAFTIVATDLAGNTAQRTLTVNRVGTVTTDVALQWNQQALEAIRMTVMDPPLAARVLAMVSLAQYDTLAAIDGTPAYLIHETATGPISVDVALAKAAYTVLYAVFPSQRQAFDATLNALLGTIADGAAKNNAIALGLSIGSGILAVRSNDGSDDFVDYPGSTDVGMWRPDAPMFDVASEPQWGGVTPFAITSADEFLPDAPPALDSAEYAQSVNEIQSLGSATSSTRTADQTEIAQFWADGKGSYTPVGHWDLIAQQVALSAGNSLSSNVRLFAELNVAMADSGIVAWDAKYTFGLWRPIDAIQNADQDSNAATIADPNWTPLLITPSFPEYVSGHSTFSAAAAAILAATFGDNTAFSNGAFTLPGVTRNFTSFTQAAEEAGRSRIYGGIHYEFTNQAGQQLGREVAAAVLDRFVVNQDVQPPTVIADPTPAVTSTNVALTGQILDNISGVAQAQFKIDTGAFQPLTLDGEGRFSITTALTLNGASDGPHTITIQAVDAASNVAPLFTRSFVLDSLLPLISLDSIADNAIIDASTRLTGVANPTGSNLSVLNYKFDSEAPRPLIFDSTTGSFNEPVDLGNLGIGIHTLTLTAQDAAGNQAALTRNVSVAAATPLIILDITPADGSGDVGSTFRPQAFFSKSIRSADLNSNNFFATDSTGNKLAATIVPAQDGSFAWLFFTAPMPGGETITINIDGSTIHSLDGTQLLDADGDGVGGGLLQYSFTTVSLTLIPGTTLTGRVLDPGPDLQPMTFDDIRRGPDGILYTADDVFLNPIAGAKVFITGRESEFVITDAQGSFTLTNVPAGDVKLVIDGRTATNAPSGFYFPEMVMDLSVEPGLPNTVMGSMGTSDEQHANESRGEVYLPRLAQSILQTVSDTENTIVGVDAISSPNLTDAERAQLKLVVQPGSLIDANGNAMAGGQVGISTVPAELVRDMLPPGLLQHTFDITIQAPGVAAFNTPLQITFPNTFNAAPGTKLNFLSFDHTTGRLVIEGTATVSADGLSVTTDPGQGITKPGWHGVTPPGNTGNPPPRQRFLIRTKGSVASGVRGSDLTEALYRFDFGTANSPVASGYTRITPSDIFSDSVGYGWDLAPGQSVDAVDRANSSVGDLNRDFNATKDGNFVVNVPDGFYAVTITLGDASAAHNKMGVYEQTILVNNITTRAGEFIKNLYVFPVTGGKMILSFASLISGTEPVAITSIEIQPVDDEPVSPIAAPPPLGDRLFYYAYDNLDSGFVTRGSARSLDEISSNVFFTPNTRYLQFIFDPKTMTISSSAFTTPASGLQVELPDVLLEPPYTQDFEEYVVLDGKEPPLGGDSDSDGLSDDIEFVIGTNPHQWSTANDGISDKERVLEGLDPSGGRAVPTGIVGALTLKGEAKGVALEGGVTSAETQTAYLATGSYGLAIVNVSQFKTPVVLSQLDLPGNSVDVSVDSLLKIAAVASDDSGLYLVDVSNPQTPVVLRTINAMASQVEVVDGIAYAAVSNELRAYDMLTGEKLDTLTILNGNITTLAREGSMLYLTDSTAVLTAVDISSGFMVAKGSLSVPGSPSKLFVGGGIAYVAGSNSFSTVSVANPNSLALLSGPDALNLAVKAIAVNGSGLAVSVGSPLALGNQFEIFNVSDPTVTNAFLGQYVLPAIPYDVVIGGGLAFVADGTGGLMVVNYRSFDTQGVAPVVSALAQVTDLDQATAGIQVQEGSTIPVSAAITDDVQVRNAELLINGQAIQNDLSFPFDWFVHLPSIAANGSDTVTLQVRATDTGGNIGLSNIITLKLVPDTVAPTIVNINPPDGGTRGQAFRTLVINFSEAMDESTLTADNIQLTGPGGVATPVEIQLRNLGRTVQFTYSNLQQGAQTISIKRDQVKDRAGNAIGTGTLTSSFTIVQATAVFTNAAGTGFWDQATNWENNTLPTANDDVLLDFPGAATVVFRTGTATIRSLTSAKPFTITGGTLTVTQTVQINNTFTLAGGTLKDATIIAGTGGQGLTASSSGGTLRGVALNVNSTIANGQSLSVTNGLILNAVLTLAGTGTATALAFTGGTQTLGGTGTVVLSPTGSGNQIVLGTLTSATVTVGSGIHIHGKGAITQSLGSTLINNGTISSDVSGQTLTLNMSIFTNNAVLEAINSATLSIATNSWSNSATGTITATNSTLSVAGAWSNANTIKLTNSTVTLGGSFTSAGMGTINRSGGTVNLTGTLTNSGLLLNASTGSWNLLGGTIIGGTIAFADGATLVTTASGGLLNGVTLNTDLTILNGTGFSVSNGLTLNAVLTLAGTGATTNLAFTSGTQTLGGTGTVVLSSAGSGSQILLGTTGNATVTVGSGIRIHGRGLLTQSGSPNTLINNGTISADVSGQTLTLTMSVFTNNAVMEAINGATLSIATGTWSNTATGTISATNSTLSVSGAWSNANTITMTNSTLTLGGTFTTAGMGTLNRTGGTVNLTGTLTSSGLQLNAATGSWNLLGGTIIGGTIAFADGATLVTTASGGFLNGVTLNSDLTILNGTGFSVSSGLTLNAVLTLAGAGAATNLAFTSGTQTLGGTGTIAMSAAGTANQILLGTASPPTVTIGSGIHIHGRGTITQTSSPSTLINNGTISADVAGQALTLSMSTLTNNAVMEAINGATLSIATGASSNTATGTITATNSTLSVSGAWSNANTITVTNSTLTLGGTFTTAGMGTINRTGGTVNLTGTLTSSGLLLNAVTGSWNLLSGTIIGGTIAFADGASLVTTASGGFLNGVTLNNDLTILNGTGFSVSNGLTLNAVLTLAGTGAATNLAFTSGTQTLGGTGTIAMSAAGANNQILLGTASPLTVTIGSGIHIHGRGTISQITAPSTLINNGTISADVASQALTLNMSTLTNNAVTEAINGATLSIATGAWSNTATGTITATNSTLSLSGAWSNANTITVTNSTLTLGGTFNTAGLGTINRSGGTVILTGTLTNSGLLLNAATGSWNLLGGTIVGGTITFADGATLVTTASGGFLNGVTLNSDLTILNGTGFSVSNGLTLNAVLTLASSGAATTLAFTSGTQTLGGTGTIAMSAGSNNQILLGTTTPATVTVGSGMRIHGRGSISQFSAPSTLINNGIISADVAGQALTVSLSTFTNSGTMEAINSGNLNIVGTFSQTAGTTRLAGGNLTGGGTFNLQGGTLTGSGTITANVTNNALIEVGGAGATGTLTITGNYTQTTLGTLRLEIAGLVAGTEFDRLVVSGSSTLAGTLDLQFINGFDPAVGNAFQIMTFASRVNQFTNVTSTGLSAGKTLNLVYSATNISANIT